MKGKRGQGLSMNTIVIAVIVLFVMVVLLLIFTGRIAIFNFGLQDCLSTGGQCDTDPKCQNTDFADLDGDGIKDARQSQSIASKDAGKIGCAGKGSGGNDLVYCCKGIKTIKPQ